MYELLAQRQPVGSGRRGSQETNELTQRYLGTTGWSGLDIPDGEDVDELTDCITGSIYLSVDDAVMQQKLPCLPTSRLSPATLLHHTRHTGLTGGADHPPTEQGKAGPVCVGPSVPKASIFQLCRGSINTSRNGKQTAFIQHFSNQWPLKALYNTAQHSCTHSHTYSPARSHTIPCSCAQTLLIY